METRLPHIFPLFHFFFLPHISPLHFALALLSYFLNLPTSIFVAFFFLALTYTFFCFITNAHSYFIIIIIIPCFTLFRLILLLHGLLPLPVPEYFTNVRI